MKKLSRYLLFAFAIAWALQIIAGIFYRQGENAAYQLILASSMFAPIFAIKLSKYELKEIGWDLKVKRDILWILVALFLPSVLGTLGALLYFLITPKAFDTSLSYLISSIGEEGLAQINGSNITLKGFVALNIISSLTYAPFINMFFALGEEAGWRGVMYPELKERYGISKGRIIGGVIWSIWHWPIMILAGYEYGTTYWGFPITGPLLFCLISVAMGILLDALYDKTDSIWVPSLCHGAINAFAGVPMLFLNPSFTDRLLLGPLMIGIIGGLPLIILSVMLLCKAK